MKQTLFVGFAKKPAEHDEGHDLSFCFIDTQGKVTLTNHLSYSDLAKDLQNKIGGSQEVEVVHALPLAIETENIIEEFNPGNVKMFQFYLDSIRESLLSMHCHALAT